MAAVTSRYARAFADVVFDLKLDPGAAIKELQSMLVLLEESEPLRRVWGNPAIPANQKHKLLDALGQRVQLSRPVRNFLAVLIDHRRIGELPEIVKLFEREINARLGFDEAEIVSARPLGNSERIELEAQIQRVAGKKVRATYATDARLLGGVIVKIGSTIYDGSVRGQLRKIKEQLATA